MFLLSFEVVKILKIKLSTLPIYCGVTGRTIRTFNRANIMPELNKKRIIKKFRQLKIEAYPAASAGECARCCGSIIPDSHAKNTK